MNKKIKSILVFLLLIICIKKSYSYIELGFNYQFFKKHIIHGSRTISNVQTNNIYFCIGKYYKKDSNYRYFLGLGALPQHATIGSYEVYDIHNIWQIGLARSFSITPKNKIDVFLKLRSSFLGTWKLGYVFPSYQGKSTPMRNDYFEFFHNKGIELGTEVNLLPGKLNSKLLISGSIEYKFDRPRLSVHSYGIQEEKVFYYSLGIAYRQYFNK